MHNAPNFSNIKLQWIEALCRDEKLSLLGKVLGTLLATKYVHSTKGVAWPSISTLAEDLNKSEKSISRAVRDLENCGWFEVSRGKGKCNTSTYRPCVEKIVQPEDEARKADKSVPFTDAKRGHFRPENRKDLSGKTRQECPPTPESHQFKNQGRKGPPISLIFIPKTDSFVIKKWDEWLQNNSLPPLSECSPDTSRSGAEGYSMPHRWPPATSEDEAWFLEKFSHRLPFHGHAIGGE